MLALSALSAFWLSWNFAAVLALYFVLTTSYSWRIKQIALLDVFFLAGLYTMRLVAGHAATGIKYSFWLLAFSMFIFLSLALVKRYTELRTCACKTATNPKDAVTWPATWNWSPCSALPADSSPSWSWRFT